MRPAWCLRRPISLVLLLGVTVNAWSKPPVTTLDCDTAYDAALEAPHHILPESTNDRIVDPEALSVSQTRRGGPASRQISSSALSELDEMGHRIARNENSPAVKKFISRLIPTSLRQDTTSPVNQFMTKLFPKLSFSQRYFDERGNLGEFLKAVAAAKAEGKPFDLSSYEPFWPNHGMGHAENIGRAGAELAKKLGDDLETQLGAAFYGLVHDAGMYDGGKEVREKHPAKAAQMMMGLEVESVKPQKALNDSAIRDMIADDNALTRLFREAADTPLMRSLYPSQSVEQRMDTLIREFSMGTMSHGNFRGYDLKLGASELASRTKQYFDILVDPKISDPESAAAMQKILEARYGSDPRKKFMAWAALNEGQYADNPALKKLRDVMIKSENRLNMADADRPRGSEIKPTGRAQSVIYETGNGVKLGIAITDPETGTKMLLESPSQRLGSYVTQSYSPRTEGDPKSNGQIVFRGGLSPKRFQNNVEAWSKLYPDAARVLGETAGYQARAGTNEFGDRTKTEIIIPKEFPEELRPQFREATLENFMRVNFRNAGSVLSTKSASLGNKSPVEFFRDDLTKWLNIDPRASAEAIAGKMEALYTDISSRQPSEAGWAQWKQIPKSVKDYFSGKIQFVETSAEKVIPERVAEDYRAAEKAEKENWGKILEERKLSELSDLERETLKRRLVLGGAPREPRTVKMPDGTSVEYKGPLDLIPANARLVKLQAGAKLTELGKLGYHGYFVLDGTVHGELAARMGEAPFNVHIENDATSPASSIGFTSWFNIESGQRNATVTLTRDSWLIVVPGTRPNKKLFSGPVMAQSPEELLGSLMPSAASP